MELYKNMKRQDLTTQQLLEIGISDEKNYTNKENLTVDETVEKFKGVFSKEQIEGLKKSIDNYNNVYNYFNP